ncbi:carboxylate--amine ligase [Streptomyces sp. NBC_01766]|uniref:carboxylate--amine ligase n=1 Tax=Streptomyces sp. NBC_01766 TaxID=2975936 RepID=UPI002DDBACB9|nr:ATP-grasp domain-containing protein [Streptomyces sp. NBC_01766]WSC24666.1 ATP-grasp domain-containing protein [Streptomyces sp. NBC_01766]
MPPFGAGAPALLLRLDRNPLHHGTLGAVRSLGRAGVEVHAVVESADSPVTRSRHLHHSHLRPQGRITPDVFRKMLLRISDRIGRPAVLIAMDDISAIHVAALAPRLTGRYLLPAQPLDLPERLADKSELAGLCAESGIAHPATVIPGSAADAASAARELGLPMVAKWSRPWLLPTGSGLRSTTLVRSAADAARLYEQHTTAGSRLLLQRWLPYGPGNDWFFHGYFADRDRCLMGGTGRKVLSWPVRAGLTAMGSWQPNREVELAAGRLAAHVGYRGILDLDFRRDPSTGRFHLLDFNPRPGAQFRLFTDRSGLDVVRAQYLDLTGRTVPPPVARPGRVFVAENYALLSLLASGGRPWPFAAGGTRGGGRAGTEKAGTERAWFAGDDVSPFLAMGAVWCGKGLRKGARRLRPGPRRGGGVPATRASPGGSSTHPLDPASAPR